MSCEMKERVLAYLKSDNRDLEIEAHLENCKQCQALMEGYLARDSEIILPQAECENGNLKEQVEHYHKGTRRILVFTLVGLVMGWFSYMYYTTDFLLLKVLIGIPYKLNEMVHTAFHNHSMIYLTEQVDALHDEFFPQASWVSFVAERGISALMGCAIYGSIGFFTGDKRIFTLTKYLKFAAVWICILAITIAGTFFANHMAVEKNQRLEDVSGFLLHYEFGATGFYGDDMGERDSFYLKLKNAFYADQKMVEKKSLERKGQDEELIELVFGKYHNRYMAAYINLRDQYLVTNTGKIYALNEEFCQLVRQYQEKEMLEYEENSTPIPN